ncbi:hypothetical protein PIROE2DRAFT_57172 [Piromyces sp. E2]|nr:hypothetical protein PIROE2DRAFT_57172 [Piromyces sp. E2]|eukprot:OUM69924.1 hypothetical protein PIROE2DRAFT_57172 [Piromyces sp. E2]
MNKNKSKIRHHSHSLKKESLKKNLDNDLLYKECLELSNIISREIKDIINQVRNPKIYQIDVSKPVSDLLIKEENANDKTTEVINPLATTQYKIFKKEQNITSYDINNAIKKFNNDTNQNTTDYDTKLSTKKHEMYNSYGTSPSIQSMLPYPERNTNNNSIKTVPSLIDEIEAITESNTEYHYIDDTEENNNEEKDKTDSDSGLPPKLPDDYSSSLSSVSSMSLTFTIPSGSSFNSKYSNHKKRMNKYSSNRKSLSSPNTSPDASYIIKNGSDGLKESESGSNTILSIINEDESDTENDKTSNDVFCSISPITKDIIKTPEENDDENEAIVTNAIKKLENSVCENNNNQDSKKENNDDTNEIEVDSEIGHPREIEKDVVDEEKLKISKEDENNNPLSDSVHEIEQRINETPIENKLNDDIPKTDNEITIPETHIINESSTDNENNDNKNNTVTETTVKNKIEFNDTTKNKSNKKDTMSTSIPNTIENKTNVPVDEIPENINNEDNENNKNDDGDDDAQSIHSNSTNSSISTLSDFDIEEAPNTKIEQPPYHKSLPPRSPSTSKIPTTPSMKAISSPSLLPKYTPGISNKISNPNFSLHSRRPSSSLSMSCNSPSFLPVLASPKLNHKTSTSSDKTYNNKRLSVDSLLTSSKNSTSKKLNRLSLDSISASPKLSITAKHNSIPSSPRPNTAKKVAKHPPPAPSSYMSCRHTRYQSLNDNDLKPFRHKGSFDKNEKGSGFPSPQIPTPPSYMHSKIPMSPQLLNKRHSRTLSNSSNSSLGSLPLPPSSIPLESSKTTNNIIIPNNKRNSISSIPIPSPKSNASTTLFNSHIPSPKLSSSLPKTK